MLRIMEAAEFDRYIELAYELAMDPARSGYPTYCDGMKTKGDFVERTRESMERADEDVLVFEENGTVEGVIAFQHQEGERYLHVHCLSIRKDTGRALEEFVEYCRERWPGAMLDVGLPAETVDARSWLEGQGVPCIERSWNYLFDLSGYQPAAEVSGVRPVTEENFEEFAAIHRRVQGEMYWNCERIRKAMADWHLFITGTGDEAGEVILTGFGSNEHQEIFALVFADGKYRAEPFRALLTAALHLLKEKGTRWLTFFVDVGGPEKEVLDKMGFRCVGEFQAYRVKL